MAPTASAGGGRRRMALSAEQRWIATKIDTRMQRLIRAGKDDMAIVAAMADHSGQRAIVHSVLCLLCFYFGFISKPKRSNGERFQ
jgi:hypothetical protein